MEFEETGNVLTLDKTPKHFIYFLLQGNTVVFIGKLQNDFSKIHKYANGDYDTIKVLPCPTELLEAEESRLIEKYKPIYNREIWRKVSEFPNYSISNQGRVRHDKRNHIRKIFIDKDGYEIVALQKNGKPITRRVHKLVALAFVPNPLNKPCVDHIDTNKLNNNADNLRWVTQRENCNNPLTKLHKVEAGKKISKARKGIKLSEETKRKISEARMRRKQRSSK